MWVISFFLMMVWAPVLSVSLGKSAARGIWEGYLNFGSGDGSFQPCKSRETWWVKSKGYNHTADELREQYNAVAETPYEPIYARVRADVSKKGQYGRLGSYQRVMYVEEILEVRPPQANDCH